MSTGTVADFLKELDDTNNAGDPAARRACTVALLEVGDKIFDESVVLQALLADGTFQQTISGQSYIPEKLHDGSVVQRPVIDLVQQGGSMLGIALLGYTYVMEKAGVRFRSMAGTSAGAINTLLLSALPEKIYSEASPFINDGRQAVKSEFLAHLVANKNFSDFLDRGGTIGRLQQKLLRKINSIERILPYMLMAAPLLMLAASYAIYSFVNRNIFNLTNGLTENEIRIYNFITGTIGLVAMVVAVLFFFFKLFKTNMGINRGEVVYDWMRSILQTPFVNIHTTADLKQRKQAETPVVHPQPATPARLVFIAANLTHNRIVKFPENTSDYWDKKVADLVHPAAYVRASMSLPFIFYAFIPNDRHVKGKTNGTSTVHTLARFIDGGMLSNFPIREFHVPPGTQPKYPTFGVLLSARPPTPPQHDATERQRFFSLSVFKFIVSFISTFRNFYDNDFLNSHPEFQQLVQTVDTRKFNSLDFGMSFQTKQQLFAEGAKSAVQQLITFKWEVYLETRNGKPPTTS